MTAGIIRHVKLDPRRVEKRRGRFLTLSYLLVSQITLRGLQFEALLTFPAGDWTLS
jgi:hypothetical protein